MPINMPEETLITVQYRDLAHDFEMPQMEMAETHYSLGYLINGDRRIITPYQQFDAHDGDITLMPPLLYHRTLSLSERPYRNYLVKMSEKFAEDFQREVDPEIWRLVFEQRHITLSDEDSAAARRLLEDMLKIYDGGAKYAEVILKGLLYRFLVLVWERNRAEEMISFKNKLSDEIMEAMYYIERNYPSEIRLADAAAFAGFSEGHFSRLFAAQVGVSFSEYLRNTRLRHVKELLIHTGWSISEIAIRTGFSNSDYLSACFASREGMTPTAFRRASDEGRGGKKL